MVALPLLAACTGLLATIQVYSIGLALAGVPMSQPLAVTGLVLAVGAAVLLASRFGVRSGVAAGALEREFRGDDETGGAPLEGGWPRIAVTSLAVVALSWLTFIWLQLLLVAWQRDPLGWDALWYHLPAVHEWTLRGGPVFLPLPEGLESAPHEVLTWGWVNFPMGVELTGFFVHHLLGTDRLIDATNLWYWPLGVTALAVIAGRLGVTGPGGWLAGGLLFGVATFLAQSASFYIDPAFASAVLAAMAAALVLLFPEPGEDTGWTVVLFGAALGLVLGGKGPGLPYAGALGILAAGVLLWRRRYERLRAPLLRIGAGFLVMMAVGGYWSVRNAVHTGNPLHPIQLEIGEKVLAHGYDLTGYATLDWIVRPSLKPYPPWSRLFVSWLQPDSPLLTSSGSSYSGVGGLGFLWLLGALPAALYAWWLAVRRRDRRLLRGLGFLTAAVLTLLALTTLKWQGRYTYWLYGLGLPALVFVLGDALRRTRRNAWNLVPVLLLLGAIGVAAWESAGMLDVELRRGAVEAADGTLTYPPVVDQLWPGMSEVPGFARLLAADAVARGPWLGGSATRFGGVLALPLGKRSIRVLPPEPTPAEVALLPAAGIRWLLWTAPHPDSVPAAVRTAAVESWSWGDGATRYFAYDLGPCTTVPEGAP